MRAAMQQLRDAEDSAAPVASRPIGYVPISAADATQFSEQAREWNFEFTQLKRGKFSADGAFIVLDGVCIERVSFNQTLLQRGYVPRNVVAVFLPGAGSAQPFVRGQLIEPGQCATLAEGETLDVITHAPYVDVGLAFDLNACRHQLDALNGGSMGGGLGTAVVAPGPSWIADMLARVEWLMASVLELPQCLGNDQVRASLADRVLAAMVRFDASPADVDSGAHAARANRRVSVRLARDLIHSRLSEPLRLSELCRHARLKIRSLEYGFREVTGLTPVAYIKSLRLNGVRKALRQDVWRQRSISEIAMDAGFWHLSQFAVDYRRFFGETPTETRRRSVAKDCAPAATRN